MRFQIAPSLIALNWGNWGSPFVHSCMSRLYSTAHSAVLGYSTVHYWDTGTDRVRYILLETVFLGSLFFLLFCLMLWYDGVIMLSCPEGSRIGFVFYIGLPFGITRVRPSACSSLWLQLPKFLEWRNGEERGATNSRFIICSYFNHLCFMLLEYAFNE